MKNSLTMLAILVLINTAIAQDPKVEVIKTAPSEIRINEILKVDITIKNNLDRIINVELRETVAFGKPIDKENLFIYQNITRKENETIVQTGNETVRWLTPDGKCEVGCKKDGICDPDCGCTAIQDPDCAAFWISPQYIWKFSMEPNSEKKISYRINATQMGKLTIGSTTARTSVGEFYSNPLAIRVRCDGNGICEINKGEYYLNCPEDCRSGGRDDYCDRVIDGRCDPDCRAEEDPDCIKAVCGDGKCEKSETYQNCPEDCPRPVICGDNICEGDENYLNCPQDCPSGGEDGYCDAVDDGRCDPDCRVDIDLDCPRTFGNGVCEPGFGENYLTCPKDCPSGSRDGYCDKVIDGRCDPDCRAEEDPDCEAVLPPLLYMLFGLVIVVCAVLIYLKIRKPEE
ncbi:MAG: hypothetical protein KAU03_04755 [Candidatus Altiarchaeales archaeon]|nr:hypothetical protein [Candidatus Altiarchaeales archaeon]